MFSARICTKGIEQAENNYDQVKNPTGYPDNSERNNNLWRSLIFL